METQQPPQANEVSTPTEILTLERAAKILDCNERILNERLKNGEIRAYKQARRWYILHDDLIAWVKAGEVNGGKKK